MHTYGFLQFHQYLRGIIKALCEAIAIVYNKNKKSSYNSDIFTCEIVYDFYILIKRGILFILTVSLHPTNHNKWFLLIRVSIYKSCMTFVYILFISVF